MLFFPNLTGRKREGGCDVNSKLKSLLELMPFLSRAPFPETNHQHEEGGARTTI
jgi:hypothetical protein